MLVMALAHARKSGDGLLIHRYYSRLKTWGDHLVTNGLQLNGRYTHHHPNLGNESLIKW